MATTDHLIPRGPRRGSQQHPKPDQPQNDQQPIPQNATSESGNQNRASASDGAHSKGKKPSTLKRVLLIIGLALLLVLGGLGAFAFWYTSSIANNMAMGAAEKDALDKVLATAQNAEQPFYVLLVGSDNGHHIGERSDVMLLARIDPNVPQITLVSIPRDTPYWYNGQKVKINYAYEAEGAAGAVKAAQELTGVPISYYAEIDFGGLEEYVDYLGGVTVTVPQAFDYTTSAGNAIHIRAGEQTLNGTQAVALARMRTIYEGNQDEARQKNVRAMSIALFKKVLSGSPTDVLDHVQHLSTCMKTNMPLDKMADLARKFTGEDVKIYSVTGPTDGGIDESANGQWLCYENPQAWADIMKKVDAGQDPKAS